MKPRLLDLFCGAGGAAMGYHRAGFDVVGVDINPQPNFPFEFVQADALEFLGTHLRFRNKQFDKLPLAYDAIHASPPCQAFSLATLYHRGAKDTHPDLIEPTRTLLNQTGLPWVIENVVGSPIEKSIMLCGEQFGLRVHRHRYFETGCGLFLFQQPHQQHRLKGADHNCHIEEGHTRIVAGNYADHQDASDAMGIDWMTRSELKEAIPPAYTEFIGRQILEQIGAVAA